MIDLKLAGLQDFSIEKIKKIVMVIVNQFSDKRSFKCQGQVCAVQFSIQYFPFSICSK